jgi:hypothetical protein
MTRRWTSHWKRRTQKSDANHAHKGKKGYNRHYANHPPRFRPLLLGFRPMRIGIDPFNSFTPTLDPTLHRPVPPPTQPTTQFTTLLQYGPRPLQLIPRSTTDPSFLKLIHPQGLHSVPNDHERMQHSILRGFPILQGFIVILLLLEIQHTRIL